MATSLQRGMQMARMLQLGDSEEAKDLELRHLELAALVVLEETRILQGRSEGEAVFACGRQVRAGRRRHRQCARA